MEVSLGFLAGAVVGFVVTILVMLIVGVSRRAVASGKTTVITQPLGTAAPSPEQRSTREHRRTTGHTMIVENIEERGSQLNRSIQDVKNLLLRLADVISSTGDASGRAAETFSSARDTIGQLGADRSSDFGEAQRVLVQEIDRVLKTNATLHSELEQANKGIAEQRRQIEELRQQARIDGLTRIPNRAAFDERLAEYVSLLDRTDMIFSLLLLDIDFFKKVNDEHGHLNGDRILRGIAAKISESIRTNDIATRYGGEEFAVIFPGTEISEALAVSERIRRDIARTNFRLDEENVRMTISGGVAQCEKGMNTEAIIATADKALYAAKVGGRNQINAATNERPNHNSV
jgi:diguanylate cyclase (GGDEF) domain